MKKFLLGTFFMIAGIVALAPELARRQAAGHGPH